MVYSRRATLAERVDVKFRRSVRLSGIGDPLSCVIAKFALVLFSGIPTRAQAVLQVENTADDHEVVEDACQRTFAMENVMKPKLVILTVIAMTSGFLTLSASALTPGSPMGAVVPLSGAMRTIPIDAKTKYVNVTAHETVKFVANGTAFAINFRGSSATTFAFVPSVFDLNELAPAGVLNHKVKVYVAPDPLYISG